MKLGSTKKAFQCKLLEQNIFFTARGRGAILRMPRPLLGSQIKAEIKGFPCLHFNS